MNLIIQKSPELGLFLLRVLVSLSMLSHGYPKLMKLFSGAEIQFPDPIGIGVTASFVLVVFAEFFCSLLLIIGYKVRLAAIPLATTMIVAAFIAHGADPWDRKEKAIMYLITYIVLIIAGGGKFSLSKN